MILFVLFFFFFFFPSSFSSPLALPLSRWIRLLFSREFPFQSTLAVWDALLADFELLDYLCLAMVLYIRDYGGCLCVYLYVCVAVCLLRFRQIAS